MKRHLESKSVLVSLSNGFLAIYLGGLISEIICIGRSVYAQDIAEFGGYPEIQILLGYPQYTGYLLGIGSIVLSVVKGFFLKVDWIKIAVDCVLSAVLLCILAFVWYAVFITPSLLTFQGD
jgi:hypothetical protein